MGLPSFAPKDSWIEVCFPGGLRLWRLQTTGIDARAHSNQETLSRKVVGRCGKLSVRGHPVPASCSKDWNPALSWRRAFSELGRTEVQLPHFGSMIYPQVW